MIINKRIWKPVFEVAAILGAAAALFTTDAAAANLCTDTPKSWTSYSICSAPGGHMAISYGNYVPAGPRANVTMYTGSHPSLVAGTSVYDWFGNPLRRLQTSSTAPDGTTYSDSSGLQSAATHYSMICPSNPGC